MSPGHVPPPGAPPGAGLRDIAERWPVAGAPHRARGVFATLRTDQVRMPDGEVVARDVLEHPGAVAMVALDGTGRVLLIRQYRHPAGGLLWELPAGVCDVDGESPLAAARRELREEAGLAAASWQVLADVYPSPGISTEQVRAYLARELSPVASQDRGGPLRHEEAHLLTAWVPLADAVSAVLAGDLHNGVAAVGILAAYAAWQGGFGALRPAGEGGS